MQRVKSQKSLLLEKNDAYTQTPPKCGATSRPTKVFISRGGSWSQFVAPFFPPPSLYYSSLALSHSSPPQPHDSFMNPLCMYVYPSLSMLCLQLLIALHTSTMRSLIWCPCVCHGHHQPPHSNSSTSCRFSALLYPFSFVCTMCLDNTPALAKFRLFSNYLVLTFVDLCKLKHFYNLICAIRIDCFPVQSAFMYMQHHFICMQKNIGLYVYVSAHQTKL